MQGPLVKPEIGKFGIGLAGLGVGLAVGSLVLQLSQAPLALLAGAGVYLVGAALSVAAFGYRRGSNLFLTLRVLRLVFAAVVIFSILRIARG